jgi:hypothetical protein
MMERIELKLLISDDVSFEEVIWLYENYKFYTNANVFDENELKDFFDTIYNHKKEEQWWEEMKDDFKKMEEAINEIK